MTRIVKFRSIKNFGFFKNYSWPPSGNLQSFNQINLIYGFNASGKTSMSRIFSVLEAKKPKTGSGYAGAEFTIEIDAPTGQLIKHDHLEDGPLVKVFNRDFVKEHIELEVGKANTFYHLIKLDPEDKKLLSSLEKRREGLVASRDGNKSQLEALEAEKARLLTTTAGKVKAALAAHKRYLNYRAPDLKDRLAPLLEGRETAKVLGDDELPIQTTKATSKTPPLSIKELDQFVIKTIDTIDATIAELLTRQLSVDFIESLKSDPELNEWAKRGYDLHKKTGDDVCIYCNSPISTQRAEELSQHFSEVYMSFVAELNGHINDLTNDYVLPELPIISDKEFDATLQVKAGENILACRSARENFNKATKEAVAALAKKRDAPSINPKIPTSIKTSKDAYDAVINDLNATIQAHNTCVVSHAQELDEAAASVELHYASEILETVKDLDKKINTTELGMMSADTQLISVLADISNLEKRTTGDGPAIVDINKTITNILGRNDLQLASAKGTSFEIQRHGKLAETLSEGEQTAIAFAYFCAKLKEKGVSLGKTILVIDDPISSLDHHRLYAVAGKIREVTPQAHQCFLFTHNYEFFRELRKWLKTKNERLKDAAKPEIANFYYLEANVDATGKARHPNLQELPNLLLKYDSDYHFNFEQLHKFAGTGDVALAYFVPNIARKVLETYLAFKNPGAQGLGGLDKICADDTIRSEITRFLDFSNHADYIDRITQVDHTVISGAKDVANKILTVMQSSDSGHYAALEKMCR